MWLDDVGFGGPAGLQLFSSVVVELVGALCV